MAKTVNISIDNKSVPAYEAVPEGEVKGGLIVIHEVWGLSDHIKDVADRLAGEGYLSLAPDLLSETEIASMASPELQEGLFDPERRNQVQPRLRELMTPLQAPGFGEETVRKLKACFSYLAEKAGKGNRVGVIGFCFGGTYAFSLAVNEPELAVALPFYGHSDMGSDELSKITCPVRAFYGENDERLMSGLDDLTKRMKEANVDFKVHTYSDAGHAFFNDTNRFAYNSQAAQSAWEEVKQYLRTYIG